MVSDICDNRKFVLDGVTGFLTKPDDPATIADAILRFHRMPIAAKRTMGQRARAHAEALFDPDRFADGYAALIERVAPGRRSPATESPFTADFRHRSSLRSYPRCAAVPDRTATVNSGTKSLPEGGSGSDATGGDSSV